ncbi:MAG TPA: alpha/beta hydrolase [Candidatus Binataceae bacterium]|nr:alpha/beta hydrolase [Candidatus Binataceae bacterium]
MPIFDSRGVRIHYEDHGAGAPVMLVHGFGTSARRDWGDTGLIEFLATRYRVIAPDHRGHGRSDKPHERERYGMGNMSGDLAGLLDHLGIRRTLLAGYSMGSRISLELILGYPARIRAAVLGGFGGNGAMSVPGQRQRIAAMLASDDPDAPHAAGHTDDLPRRFRRGVERPGNDLKALAACMGAEETMRDLSGPARVAVPVLLLAGTRDRIVGDPHGMTPFFSDAQVLRIDGADHLSAPADRRFREAIAEYFAHAPA